MIRLIAAVDRELGIAKGGIMPWKIPDDEQYFTNQTKSHGGYVLSGRVTFEQAYKGRPLVDRHNFILSRSARAITDAEVINDLEAFLSNFSKDLWVAGGAEVFAAVIKLNKADELYLTHIDALFGCDRFFPAYSQSFEQIEKSELKQQNGFNFYYGHYLKKNLSGI